MEKWKAREIRAWLAEKPRIFWEKVLGTGRGGGGHGEVGESACSLLVIIELNVTQYYLLAT